MMYSKEQHHHKIKNRPCQNLGHRDQILHLTTQQKPHYLPWGAR